jgi:serine protease Do
MNGDVIGINTAILGRNGSIGIGFSIPSNSAKIVIDQLIEFGETKRGWLLILSLAPTPMRVKRWWHAAY